MSLLYSQIKDRICYLHLDDGEYILQRHSNTTAYVVLIIVIRDSKYYPRDDIIYVYVHLEQ